VLGALNFGVSGAVSPVVGLLGIGTAIPMGAVMAVTAVLAIASLWFIAQPRAVPALED
jgi:DHA1 family bicyclomycin/chloramphenicol resistance-like MFS transporter